MDNNLQNLVIQVKTKLDIASFFRQRGMDLKETGNGRYVALCPFHHEKTPSFSINPELGQYYCFGCHEHGDMFTYMEKRESMSFMDALEMLCEQLSIPFVIDEKDQKRQASRRLLLQILEDTDEFFKSEYDKLTEEHAAKRQISKRNVTTKNSEHFNLFGWAPENSQKLVEYLRKKGYKDEDMIASGAVMASKENGRPYTLWRARLMFSMRNTMGKTVGFSGRQIFGDTSKRKYVNSADNLVFHKSEIMFCEDIAKTKAREDHEVYVVEGQFDVIAMQLIGKTNTVATSGTAFTPQHAAMLGRFVGKDGRLIFCLDADKAGQNAELRIFQNLGPMQGQAYAVVTEDKDPSDMYRDDPEALKRQISNPIPLWEHILGWMLKANDVSTLEGRSAFKTAVRDVYSYIVDADTADSFIRMASLKSSITMDAFTENVKKKDAPDMDKAPRNAVDYSREDPRNKPVRVKRAVMPTNDLDKITDNLLALAFENKELRKDLAKLRFSNNIREGFRQILLENPDMQFQPESFAEDLASTYILLLIYRVQQLHNYENPDAIVDSRTLFQQQLSIYRNAQARIHIQNEIARFMPSVEGTMSEQALDEYAKNVHCLVDRMNVVKERNSVENPVFGAVNGGNA